MDEKIKLNITEFLKSFIRLIVQANLYTSHHPQVKNSAGDFKDKLKSLCTSLSVESIKLSLSDNKLLLNGTAVLSSERIPPSLLSIYKNCHIDSIEIMGEVSEDELIIFAKVGSCKQDIKSYLESKGVSRIKVFSEKYVVLPENKIQENKKNIPTDFEGKNFVESIKDIVGRLYPEEEKQKEVVALLLKKFKQEVEQAIERAVSEIKKEKIKAENDYLRVESVISSIAGSEIIIDRNGNVIMTTPQAEIVTGKKLSEISGKKLYEIIPQKDNILSIAKNTDEISDKRIDTSVEIKGDGDFAKTVKNATAVIKNEDGKIIGTITVPHDVIKLREIDQMKSDFISMITHELKSPLTSIKMALDMIAKENLDPSSKSIINAAVRNTERLNSIISDILDFSKLQSGRMVFNLEKLSAGEVVESAITSMKAWATSKNINLYSNISPGLLDIYADRRKTEQILINLISNAIKFTPEGGKIEVGAISNGQYVRFYVKDTGIGIKKEDREKIFEKFVQAVSGEKIGGTGLGLAITKAMVVMQGGNITLESEVGKGSTFFVDLPIYKAQKRLSEEELKEEKKEVSEKKPWWKRIFFGI